jgi:dihydrofolate reductase
MARLIYSALMSLDGFTEDASGRFDWAKPDEEVHAFVNDLVRPLGTHLYGRRMYEVMAVWETISGRPDQPPYILDFAALWQAADKIVFSTTLREAASARTRIERQFDPQAVRRMKDQARRDFGVSGPNLAAQAFRAGLVDECHLILAPVIVGTGKRALLGDLKLELALQEVRRFGNGMVYLHYQVSGNRALM